MLKTLTINRVEYLEPSSGAAAKFFYYYTISDTNKTEQFRIKVIVSDVVCLSLGFNFWHQDAIHFHNLNKIVVQYVKDYIINSLSSGETNSLEEFKLYSENLLPQPTSKLDDLPEVEGLSFEFEI